jgi:Ca-activated chloride channel family protein
VIELAKNSSGWGTVGGPWGQFKFGHGHPDFSNSGRLSIVAEIQSYSQSHLAVDNTTVWSNGSMQYVGSVEETVFHLGRIDTDLLDKMVARGPGTVCKRLVSANIWSLVYLHGVTNYESNVISYNQKYSCK